MTVSTDTAAPVELAGGKIRQIVSVCLARLNYTVLSILLAGIEQPVPHSSGPRLKAGPALFVENSKRMEQRVGIRPAL